MVSVLITCNLRLLTHPHASAQLKHFVLDGGLPEAIVPLAVLAVQGALYRESAAPCTARVVAVYRATTLLRDARYCAAYAATPCPVLTLRSYARVSVPVLKVGY